MLFVVLDNETGKEPDLEAIAKEEWAKQQGMDPIDMNGFAIDADGDLMLLNDHSDIAFCPEGRFTVEWLTRTKTPREELYDAMIAATRRIRDCHRVRLARMTDEYEKQAWQSYFNHSPEMEPIRKVVKYEDALTPAERRANRG